MNSQIYDKSFICCILFSIKQLLCFLLFITQLVLLASDFDMNIANFALLLYYSFLFVAKLSSLFFLSVLGKIMINDIEDVWKMKFWLLFQICK